LSAGASPQTALGELYLQGLLLRVGSEEEGELWQRRGREGREWKRGEKRDGRPEREGEGREGERPHNPLAWGPNILIRP